MWTSLIACIVDVPVRADFSAAAGDPERGRYLGEHVANCLMCHSQRDWTRLGAPNTDGALGAGHGSTQQIEPFPEGTVVWTRNLTSDPATGLGAWSDGEIARAVTSGLSRDGTPLFLNMPYDQFSKLAEPDLVDLVAWLRTVPPVERKIPDRVLPFPLGLVVRTMPMEPALVAEAPTSGPARGAYLANLGSCVWCHSPVDSNSVVVPGKELSGGHTWEMPSGGTVASANLTSHSTGLGGWSKEAFVGRFRGATAESMHGVEVGPGGFQTPMPWVPFSGMREEDLGAIWEWLQTQPPRENTVVKWTPAP
jgi:mono/diheme cytochrome c family protein